MDMKPHILSINKIILEGHRKWEYIHFENTLVITNRYLLFAIKNYINTGVISYNSTIWNIENMISKLLKENNRK